MMNDLKTLTGCDLHVHLAGSFYADDFFEIGKAYYQQIDWNKRDFLENYHRVFGTRLDPVQLFTDAIAHPDGLAELRQAYIFNEADGGDFERFMWKFRFFQCLWAYGWEEAVDTAVAMTHQALHHHRQQGLDYVEYRASFFGDYEESMARTRLCIERLQAESDDTFTARFILPILRDPEMLWPGWQMLTELLRRYPALTDTVVGVDFAGVEEGNPPKTLRPFFRELHRYNHIHPQAALDVVYHVGESFFDKSLESAIRWCHEAALLGAKRLGHCIALGLDPEIAIARRPQAHETEPISERLDQIAYDLKFETGLRRAGVPIDRDRLQQERAWLQTETTAEVTRPYTRQRLQEIRRRQQFVLDQFSQMGTVIECCPTSNLRIGGVPDESHHPVHRFLASRVNLVLCTDDPGIFDITLADEVNWVLTHTDYTVHTLRQRLGDPRRFRLGQARTNVPL